MLPGKGTRETTLRKPGSASLRSLVGNCTKYQQARTIIRLSRSRLLPHHNRPLLEVDIVMSLVKK
jgi:hypothetical protein